MHAARHALRVGLAGLALGACRPYDSYTPVANQDGLIPASRFALYGREQSELVAIGRSLAAWKMTDDAEGYAAQARSAECFARRFPDVEAVDADPSGHRLTVKFKSGWRAAVLPIPDGVAADSTPGIPPLGPSPCRS
ncbi:MAG TPA: hypothetical protein VGQ17_16605 [Gemmatimonadales bacterium]|jgi:hypothetical protein|nr:hypothetical protein [Gemmatimonadales bacterium]